MGASQTVIILVNGYETLKIEEDDTHCYANICLY